MHAEFARVKASPVQGEVLSAEKRRGCWELKNPLSNSVRDEFSVTPEFAIIIKIDVTEKLSRNRDLTSKQG